MIKQLPEGSWLAALAINEAGERVIAASLLESGELNDLCVEGDPIGAKVLIEPAAENSTELLGLPDTN